MNNPWFAISMGLIGIIVGYSVSSGVQNFAKNGAPTQAAEQQAAAEGEEDNTGTPPQIAGAMVLGKSDAPVTVIEFSDIQCPFCRKWYRDTYGQLKKTYIETGKVKFAYRHLPLDFHPGAIPAAIAVECGHVQSDEIGFRVHDAIFDGQDKTGNMNTVRYTDDDLIKWSSEAKGLNKEQWEKCFKTKATEDRIKKDLADGKSAGIDGTPGFWILGPNGQARKIAGAYPFSKFQTEIDAMLK